MSRWNVFDHNGIRPIFMGRVSAHDYDSALQLACHYWSGQVANVQILDYEDYEPGDVDGPRATYV